MCARIAQTVPVVAGVILAVCFSKLIKACLPAVGNAAYILDALHLGFDLPPSHIVDVVISSRDAKVLVGVVADFKGFIERLIRIFLLDVIDRYGEKHVVDIDAKYIKSLHQVICRLR